jgi:hypothetical protein
MNADFARLYTMGSLADAAYVDFTLEPGQVLSGESLQNALLARMSSAQAVAIANRYALVAKYDSNITGFQAVVFRDELIPAGQPGRFVLAIRGFRGFRGGDAGGGG